MKIPAAEKLIIAPTRIVLRAIENVSGKKLRHRKLLVDAIPLADIENTLVLGPAIGGPALLAALTSLGSNLPLNILLIGTAGGFCAQQQLAIADIILPIEFCFDENSSDSETVHEIQPEKRRLPAKPLTLNNPISDIHIHQGIIWTTNRPDTDSMQTLRSAEAENIIGIEMEGAYLADFSAKHSRHFFSAFAVSDVFTEAGRSTGFRNPKLLETLCALAEAALS